jgi:hypothetical protein
MMKKVLYGTTALLAAGMFTATAEAATPLKLSVGGYLNAFMGYTNLSDKDVPFEVNKFALGTDGQIIFSAETKLDNGMKFGAIAELNISRLQQTTWLSEVFAYGENKYGKMEIGATGNAAVKLHHEVMDASGVWGTDKSKLVNWMGFADYINARRGGVSIADFDILDSTAVNEDGNAQKISYFSPKFYGFQVGATYTPGTQSARPFISGSGAMNSTVVAGNRNFSRAYAVSAAYDGKMGPVTLGADVTYGNSKFVGAHLPNGKPSQTINEYAAGLNVGFSGFTFGAGYKIRDYGMKEMKDSQAFDIGLGYENGPYAVSASWFASRAGKNIGFKMPKLDIYQVSGSYKLGAGVSAFATFGYVDLNVESRLREAYGFADQDAWTVVTGLSLTF